MLTRKAFQISPLAEGRVKPTWTAKWLERTLTDEPGKGMGSPFSVDDARMFLQACGLAPLDPETKRQAIDPDLIERMFQWIDQAG